MKVYIHAFIFVGLDFLFLCLMYHLVRYFYIGEESFSINTYDIENFYFSIFIILFMLLYEKIYTYRYDFWQETRILTKGLVLSFLIIFSLLTMANTKIVYSEIFIIDYFLVLIFFLPVYKRLAKKVLFCFEFFRKKIKIVGNTEQKNTIKKEFKANWYLGLEHSRKNYDAIFIATKNMDIKRLNKHLSKLLIVLPEVYVLPYLTEVNLSQSNTLEYFNIRTSAIHIENRLLKKQNIILKSILETILTLLVIFPLFLVHFFIVFLIKKDSKGKVLFKQKRFGKDAKVFKCYKYRTMYENSDSLLTEYLIQNPSEVVFYDKYHKYNNDPRITKIGKFLRKTSLDELPQFFNILQGKMSLIGPRPYMINEQIKLKNDMSSILKVKPGISGLWQVSGRNELSFQERIHLDMWYIQNWSLWTDLIIFIKTIKVVFEKVDVK